MQIVWSEEIKEALERVCAYVHKYRVDVTIAFGADGDAELRVEPTYWDKDKEIADTPQTEETEAERLDRIDNEIEDAWARIKELTPQTDCGWK